MTTASVGRLAETLSPIRTTTDAIHLDSFSHDAWPLQVKLAQVEEHQHRPDIIAFATSEEDVRTVVRAASNEGVAVTARGLGSSVTGQPLPSRGGLILDLSGITGDAEIDDFNLLVTVGAGWNGGELEALLAARGYTLGHSPQSLHRSSVGGWVATMASGQLSSLYGGIEDLVVSFDVVLADGSQVSVGNIPRAAMGPDLKHLFIGAEGTLGIITRVTFRMARIAEMEIDEAFRFPTLESALDMVRTVAQSHVKPALVRLYDNAEARHVLSDDHFGDALLFVSSHGEETSTRAAHEWLRNLALKSGGESMGSPPVHRWKAKRFDFSSVENILAREGGFAETIELAHSWSEIRPLYDALRQDLCPLADNVWGHFSHMYPHGASLYIILSGQLDTDREAAERLRLIWSTAMTTALSQGAVLSHHHGAGLARNEYIERSNAPVTSLLRRIKWALDPADVLNPGKLGLIK